MNVPDELIDLFIATTHPGKGTIEARRVALAAFASRYADAERQKIAEEMRTAARTGDYNAEEYGSHKNILDLADVIEVKR